MREGDPKITKVEKHPRIFVNRLSKLGGGNSNIFYVHPYLGKIPNLTNIFQMG